MSHASTRVVKCAHVYTPSTPSKQSSPQVLNANALTLSPHLNACAGAAILPMPMMVPQPTVIDAPHVLSMFHTWFASTWVATRSAIFSITGLFWCAWFYSEIIPLYQTLVMSMTPLETIMVTFATRLNGRLQWVKQQVVDASGASAAAGVYNRWENWCALYHNGDLSVSDGAKIAAFMEVSCHSVEGRSTPASARFNRFRTDLQWLTKARRYQGYMPMRGGCLEELLEVRNLHDRLSKDMFAELGSGTIDLMALTRVDKVFTREMAQSFLEAVWQVRERRKPRVGVGSR